MGTNHRKGISEVGAVLFRGQGHMTVLAICYYIAEGETVTPKLMILVMGVLKKMMGGAR